MRSTDNLNLVPKHIMISLSECSCLIIVYTDITLVNVYVDLVVFTRIAGTLKTGSGGYWP